MGTFTREIFLGNRENRWARAYAALRWSRTDRVLPIDFPDRWANFRAVRRDRFVAAGGYDDVGYGEDMTLAPKLGEDALAAEGRSAFTTTLPLCGRCSRTAAGWAGAPRSAPSPIRGECTRSPGC